MHIFNDSEDRKIQNHQSRYCISFLRPYSNETKTLIVFKKWNIYVNYNITIKGWLPRNSHKILLPYFKSSWSDPVYFDVKNFCQVVYLEIFIKSLMSHLEASWSTVLHFTASIFPLCLRFKKSTAEDYFLLVKNLWTSIALWLDF